MKQMQMRSHVGRQLEKEIDRGVDRMFGRKRIWCFDIG